MGLGEPLFLSLAKVFASEDDLEGDLGVRLAAVLEDEAEDEGRGTEEEFWLAELVELVFTALLRRTGEPPPLGVDGLVTAVGFVIFVGAGNVVLLLVARLWGRGLMGREDFSAVLLSVGVLGSGRPARLSSSELLFERRLLLRTGDGGPLVVASLALSPTIDLGLYFGSAEPIPELRGRRVDARVAIIGCCWSLIAPLDTDGGTVCPISSTSPPSCCIDVRLLVAVTVLPPSGVGGFLGALIEETLDTDMLFEWALLDRRRLPIEETFEDVSAAFLDDLSSLLITSTRALEANPKERRRDPLLWDLEEATFDSEGIWKNGMRREGEASTSSLPASSQCV